MERSRDIVEEKGPFSHPHFAKSRIQDSKSLGRPRRADHVPMSVRKRPHLSKPTMYVSLRTYFIALWTAPFARQNTCRVSYRILR